MMRRGVCSLCVSNDDDAGKKYGKKNVFSREWTENQKQMNKVEARACAVE